MHPIKEATLQWCCINGSQLWTIMPRADTWPYLETLLVDTGLQWVETGGAENPAMHRKCPTRTHPQCRQCLVEKPWVNMTIS